MNVIIKNIENKETLLEFKTRKNIKNKKLFDEIKNKLNELYKINITDMMMYGKIDYITNTQEIHYRLFGKNLPFYHIDILEDK